MTILEALVKLRDDLKTWVTNNLNVLNSKIEEKTIPIDVDLSSTSTNPVQNKTITEEFSSLKQEIKNFESFSGDYNDLTNAPNISNDFSNNLIVADNNGNIVLKVDENGLNTTDVNVDGVSIKEKIPIWDSCVDQEDSFSGDYNDLTNKPNIEDNSSGDLIVVDNDDNIILQVNDTGLTTTDVKIGEISIKEKAEEWDNKSDFSGEYEDLVGAPGIVEDGGGNLVVTDEDDNIILQVDENGLTTTDVKIDEVSIKQKAEEWDKKSDFSGDYNDLTNKPEQFSGDYNDLTNKPELFSGDYNDLENIPTIEITNDYNDLINAPPIDNVEEDALYVIDIEGNVGFKVDSTGTHTTSLILNGVDINSMLNNVTFSQTLTSGTQIGVITIGNNEYIIYAPTNAETATTLATARTFRTNLASTSTASFNGSKNVTPGVTGVLGVANGGTGNSSVDTAPTESSTKMVTSGGVYTALTGKANSSHNQSASTITSGTLAIARGGTGVTSHTDTNYTSARYRASTLNNSQTTPTTNGVIAWEYE